jgi:hypothetical protein
MKQIKEWLWLYIQRPVKRFFRQVYNLIRWFPVIWKDRDWDHEFIYTILQTKLKYQAEYISKNNRHMNAQYDAQRMMTCVRLIEKIKKESYADEYIEFHELEFSSTKIEDSDLYQLDITTKREWFDDYFLMYPLDYKRVIVTGEGRLNLIENKKDRIASNMSRNRHARAQRILFQILDRHIGGWWD